MPTSPRLIPTSIDFDFDALTVAGSLCSRISEHIEPIIAQSKHLEAGMKDANIKNADFSLSLRLIQSESAQILSVLELLEIWAMLETETELRLKGGAELAKGRTRYTEDLETRLRRGVEMVSEKARLKLDIHSSPDITGFGHILPSILECVVVDALKNSQLPGAIELKTRMSNGRWFMDLVDHTGGLPIPHFSSAPIFFSETSNLRHPFVIGLRMIALLAEKGKGKVRFQANPIGPGALIKLELPVMTDFVLT